MSLWPIKIAVKLLLSWIPGRHFLLRRFGLFKHGNMDKLPYAFKIFNIHAKRAFPDGFPENSTVLELGPGDSLLSALIAKANGASKIYLADAGNYASRDIKFYKRAADELRMQYGLDVPGFDAASTLADILHICNAQYLTGGLRDLKTIPSNSVDFIWSHSVLEHIRKRDFDSTMKQLSRILKANGVISHIVDLQDHLDRALNNLRFPEAIWENELFARGGFYTNRIGYSRSLDYMRQSGTQVVFTETGAWEKLPTPKKAMSEPFQSVPDDELRIRTYSVVLKAA